jgi:hypothetical protein
MKKDTCRFLYSTVLLMADLAGSGEGIEDVVGAKGRKYQVGQAVHAA